MQISSNCTIRNELRESSYLFEFLFRVSIVNDDYACPLEVVVFVFYELVERSVEEGRLGIELFRCDRSVLFSPYGEGKSERGEDDGFIGIKYAQAVCIVARLARADVFVDAHSSRLNRRYQFYILMDFAILVIGVIVVRMIIPVLLLMAMIVV